MTTFNPLATQIALSQDIEIGSPEWTEGGLNAFSGQTGGHPAYGWRRPEEMTGARVRAVIANYAARGCWYDPNAHPEIESGYRMGGRPAGWAPEDSYDLPSGERGYVTDAGFVAVSGPDLQHFWIDPLLDIIDRAPMSMMVETGQKPMPAPVLARIMATSLVDSLAGMVRYHGPYLGPGRTFARVVDTLVQAQRRNAASAAAVLTITEWIRDVGLPSLEAAPGCNYAKGLKRFNIYQDLSWVLPALYDLAIAAPNGNFGERVRACRDRLAQWVLDIDAVKGGKGAWSDCTITEAMEAGDGGKALPTLIGSITEADVQGPEWYGTWAVRAADITAFIHPSAAADDYLARVVAGVNDPEKPDVKKWMVDKDRNFIS